jgi:cysteine desulfurase family protein
VAAAAREVFAAREALAELFHVEDSSCIVFANNATMALNTAIHGLVGDGGHVVTSSMEHNSVMRPLHDLRQQGRITLTVVPCSPRGELDPDDVRRAVQADTRLIVLTHASNVCGTILPIREVKERLPELPLLLDAAQTAGALPIDVARLGIDMLAFSGHKGLLGPMGTGGLYVAPSLRLAPLLHGGTGSRSEDLAHPDFMPDALEAGTPNVPGISGLHAAVRFLQDTGLATIRAHETALTRLLLEGLAGHDLIRIHGLADADRQTAVVSVTVPGRDPGDIARALDRDYGIACRASLHCAPLAHRTLGTFPHGTVRLSMNYFNTEEDVRAAVRALRAIAEEKTS